MSKICKMCGEDKPLKAYHISASAKDGRHTQCGPCRLVYRKTKTPGYARLQNVRKQYGLSPAAYMYLWQHQAGKCGVCKVQLTDDGPTRYTVDHNHATGKVRGLLCLTCNVVCGSEPDRAELLEKAARYLRADGV